LGKEPKTADYKATATTRCFTIEAVDAQEEDYPDSLSS